MNATISIFKKGVFTPISSDFVEIPDGISDDKAVLIATRQLMKQFRVELVTDETNNFETRGKYETK